MKNTGYKYLFGPVPSRRLGRSLGVDLVPHKVCTLNCVYCECGKTTRMTTQRDEYIPTKAVIDEIGRYLADGPDLDYITFSGFGEPTLHSGIGEIVGFIRDKYKDYNTALITNSTMFPEPGVIEEVLPIDVIMPSLDAATDTIFKKINRPAGSLHIGTIIESLIALRDRYTGEIWLEIFIISGLNDTEEEIAALGNAVRRIRPDRVQINTLDRPGTEAWVAAPVREDLEHIVKRLDYPGTEIIAKFKDRSDSRPYRGDIEAAIIELIKRRPCTLNDLSSSLGLNTLEINKYVAALLSDKKIKSERLDRGVFYQYME
ncbi:MAG: radical SAM protein [candidate division KSB1 bacterium]|nr:radical SAM protein [candidate division KSB1 bacterium]